MNILITGSSGHLGEALVRTLMNTEHKIIGVDLRTSEFTHRLGSIVDRKFVRHCVKGVDAIIHTATLHKPHVATHTQQQFIDTNVTGTLNLLEEAVHSGVHSFVFTSTTSVFGAALLPPAGQPAVWVTEETVPIARNIYGVTKKSAEDLCEIFHRNHALPCVILRTSRFFPEPDDDQTVRHAYEDGNVKANEFLHRRVDLKDVVNAHLLALEKARAIGFGRYIISATTPFVREDLSALRVDAPSVVKRIFPEYEETYRRLGWKMFPSIERVYINDRARQELGWTPAYDFSAIVKRLNDGKDPGSELAKLVGFKQYHLR